VNLRSYGQRDPLIEYKREAFSMFENLMLTIKTSVANTEFRATTAQNMRRIISAAQPQVRTNVEDFDGASGAPSAPARQAVPAEKKPESTQDVFASMMSQVAGRPVHAVPARRPPPPGAPAAGAPPVGRNDPCPCGSGKKYKKCCGRGQP
jgi:preprotein translocase subunit SecA